MKMKKMENDSLLQAAKEQIIPTAPTARGSGRSPARSGKGHGDASPGLRGRGDRPC